MIIIVESARKLEVDEKMVDEKAMEKNIVAIEKNIDAMEKQIVAVPIARPIENIEFSLVAIGKPCEKQVDAKGELNISKYRNLVWRIEKQPMHRWECYSTPILNAIEQGFIRSQFRYKLEKHISKVGREYYTLLEIGIDK